MTGKSDRLPQTIPTLIPLVSGPAMSILPLAVSA
jgi:hypothetical protein